MAMRWYALVIDCRDVAAQARWWAQTLDYQVIYEADDEVVVIPKWASVQEIADPGQWREQPQGLVFVPVPEGKAVKNRLHIDLAPHSSQDRQAQIADLIARGATAVDVGQTSEVTWTVLADPEGNEFCVLSARSR